MKNANFEKRNKQRKEQVSNIAFAKGMIKATSTSKLIMCFLVMCITFVLSLQPLFLARTSIKLDAGHTSDGDGFFINAPMYIAGGLDATNYATGEINYDGIVPLFASNGTVNANVLHEMIEMLNDQNVLSNPSSTDSENAINYYSTKNFGQYGDQSSWSDTKKGNAQIVVKLFETVGASDSEQALATDQLWQAVYRTVQNSNGEERDILTLYMTKHYASAQFDESEGNYLASDLRNEIVVPLYETLFASGNTFNALDKYIVTPKALPGQWQSGHYQTSAESSGAYLGSSLSASYGSSGSFIMNGMYENVIGNTNWESSATIDAGSDKFWIPSRFEFKHTGYAGTGLTTIANKGKSFDGTTSLSYLQGWGSEATYAGNRTGLWEMNAFDRGAYDYCWLRSSFEGTNSENRADYFCFDGTQMLPDSYVYNGGNSVRLAVHIDLESLVKDYPLVSKVTIQADMSNAQGSVMLSVMKGVEDDYIIAYQFHIATSREFTLTLENDSTYYVVVSKPYSWRAEYAGDWILENGLHYIDTGQDLSSSTFLITIMGGKPVNNFIVI